MELYDVLLFLHIVGVVLLFAAVTIETLAGARMRGADRSEDVASWARFTERATGPLHGVSTALLAIPGLWMAGLHDLWAAAWVQIGIGVLVVAAAVGIAYSSTHVKRIGEAAEAAGPGPVGPELRAMAGDPTLWLVHHALAGLGVGAIYIMVLKPAMVGSIVSVVVAGLLGLAVGAGMNRRAGAAAAATAPGA